MRRHGDELKLIGYGKRFAAVLWRRNPNRRGREAKEREFTEVLYRWTRKETDSSPAAPGLSQVLHHRTRNFCRTSRNIFLSCPHLSRGLDKRDPRSKQASLRAGGAGTNRQSGRRPGIDFRPVDEGCRIMDRMME